ncbi:MAG: hypothetical protein AB8B93_08720 [Pseudomonadales bacterium]
MPFQRVPQSCFSTKPECARAQGRAHWLIIGSLVVISALWVGADSIRGDSANNAQAGDQGSIASAKNAAALARAAATENIEVMRVTAPRVVTPTFTFEKPATDLALGAPEAPEQHWSQSDS